MPIKNKIMLKKQIKDVVAPGNKKDERKKPGLFSITREDIKKTSAATPVSVLTEKLPAQKEIGQSKSVQTIEIISKKPEIAPKKTESAIVSVPKTEIPPSVMENDAEEIPPRAFGKKKMLLSLAGVGAFFLLVLIAGFAATPFLSSAKIYITPRNEDIEAAYDISARKNPSSGELGFQVISVSTIEKIKEIPATKEIEVFKKAEGPIIIYNAYNSASQRLIKNTRFESLDGKIYRLTQSVVVPGAQVKNGEMEPGSIEVMVTADSPGEEYNIENADFTIPGFKGDPRYGKFYARSKPGASISGGFAGKKKTADEKEVEAVRDELKNQIREELQKTVMSQKPADYIIYDDGLFFSFEDGGIKQNENVILKDTVSVSQKGGVQAIIWNEKDFSRTLARIGVKDWNETDEIVIPNMAQMDFRIKDRDKISVNDTSTLNFSINGKIKAIWQIDENLLKDKIKGAKKQSFQGILGDFKDIKKAEAVIQPFWTGKFPGNTDKIKILETI